MREPQLLQDHEIPLDSHLYRDYVNDAERYDPHDNLPENVKKAHRDGRLRGSFILEAARSARHEEKLFTGLKFDFSVVVDESSDDEEKTKEVTSTDAANAARDIIINEQRTSDITVVCDSSDDEEKTKEVTSTDAAPEPAGRAQLRTRRALQTK